MAVNETIIRQLLEEQDGRTKQLLAEQDARTKQLLAEQREVIKADTREIVLEAIDQVVMPVLGDIQATLHGTTETNDQQDTTPASTPTTAA